MRTVLSGLLAAIAACGCAVLPGRGPAGPAGIDGVACVGTVAAVPAGFVERSDEPLLRQAQAATGGGSICHGRVFEVRQSVRVYRLWDDRRQNMYGQWWTFNAPAGSRESYREAHAICRSWSALDRAVSCLLKPGTRVVVGPGQSATCDEKTYAKSPVNQVYVPNDPGAGQVHVEDCDTHPWPP